MLGGLEAKVNQKLVTLCFDLAHEVNVRHGSLFGSCANLTNTPTMFQVCITRLQLVEVRTWA